MRRSLDRRFRLRRQANDNDAVNGDRWIVLVLVLVIGVLIAVAVMAVIFVLLL